MSLRLAVFSYRIFSIPSPADVINLMPPLSVKRTLTILGSASVASLIPKIRCNQSVFCSLEDKSSAKSTGLTPHFMRASTGSLYSVIPCLILQTTHRNETFSYLSTLFLLSLDWEWVCISIQHDTLILGIRMVMLIQ